MTKTTQTRVIHCRASGLTLPGVPSAPGGTATGRVLRRGEEVEITEALYEETLDRNGASWLDLTPEEQVQRYGMQKWGEGPCPPEIAVGDDDEAFQYKLGVAARTYAEAISDPHDRTVALREVQEKYGAALYPRAQ